MDCELSNSHYIIDTEVRNEGIKYADTFFVASRYCLTQIGPNKSHLKVTCEVRYIKSLMIIIKCKLNTYREYPGKEKTMRIIKM